MNKTEQNTPLVSVLMTSYNHEKWVEEAISSVLNQTYLSLELIIVDDCSSDNSVAIIENLAKNDNRIVFKHNSKNLGAVETLQIALGLSTGNYIAIISSDDTWTLEKLSNQVKTLEEHPNIGATFSQCAYIDSKSNITTSRRDFFKDSLIERKREEWLQYFFHQGNCLCHPSVLIRRECYETCGFYNEKLRLLPDYDMWIRLLFKYNIHVSTEKFINFRQHSFNESKGTFVNKVRGENERLVLINSFFSGFKDTPSLLPKVFPDISSKPYFVDQQSSLSAEYNFSKILLENRNTAFRLNAVMRLSQIQRDSYTSLNYSAIDFQSDLQKVKVFSDSERDTQLIKIPYLLDIRILKQLSPNRLSVSSLGFTLLRLRLPTKKIS